MKSTGEQLLNHVHVGFSLFFLCAAATAAVCAGADDEASGEDESEMCLGSN